jgi:hypothetical protein
LSFDRETSGGHGTSHRWSNTWLNGYTSLDHPLYLTLLLSPHARPGRKLHGRPHRRTGIRSSGEVALLARRDVKVRGHVVGQRKVPGGTSRRSAGWSDLGLSLALHVGGARQAHVWRPSANVLELLEVLRLIQHGDVSLPQVRSLRSQRELGRGQGGDQETAC